MISRKINVEWRDIRRQKYFRRCRGLVGEIMIFHINIMIWYFHEIFEYAFNMILSNSWIIL